MAAATKSGEKPKKAKTAVAKPAVKAAPKTAKVKAATGKVPAAKVPAAKVATPRVAKVAAVTAKPGVPKVAKGQAKSLTPEQRRCYVEVAAYYMAERRGFAGGAPLEDWVLAEAEIDRLLREGILKP